VDLTHPRRAEPEVLASITKGLTFLRRTQRESGQFLTFHASSKVGSKVGTGLIPDDSIFVTALIVRSLDKVVSHLPGATRGVVAAILDRGRRYLAGEMSSKGYFRYYSRNSEHRLPFDLDDTAVACSALRNFHPLVQWGENVAGFLASRDREGRFTTWFGRTADPCVDSVVNANVLAFLGKRPETRAASQYLERTVLEGRFAGSSRYYLHEAALLYCMSHSWLLARPTSLANRVGEIAIQHLARDGARSVLVSSLALTAACQVEALSEDEIFDQCTLSQKTLLAQQESDGSWAWEAFYRDTERLYGSPSLTTAFAVEGLVAAGSHRRTLWLA